MDNVFFGSKKCLKRTIQPVFFVWIFLDKISHNPCLIIWDICSIFLRLNHFFIEWGILYTLYVIAKAVGASSQCYWVELMRFKCELMLLKRQINTITKKWISAFYKMFKRDIEILILSFNHLKFSYVRRFCKWSLWVLQPY